MTVLPRLAAEIGVSGIVVVGAVLAQAAATVATDPFATLLLSEYGPLGLAVFVLYRRLDKLEERVETNAEALAEQPAPEAKELPNPVG